MYRTLLDLTKPEHGAALLNQFLQEYIEYMFPLVEVVWVITTAPPLRLKMLRDNIGTETSLAGWYRFMKKQENLEIFRCQLVKQDWLNERVEIEYLICVLLLWWNVHHLLFSVVINLLGFLSLLFRNHYLYSLSRCCSFSRINAKLYDRHWISRFVPANVLSFLYSGYLKYSEWLPSILLQYKWQKLSTYSM